MKWVKKLALAIAAVLLALLLLEGLIRLTPQNTIVRWPTPDARYGFLNRKNFSQEVRYARTNAVWSVRINALGLRGPELNLEGDPRPRVLLLGDSFTFGYGVNEADTFGRRLEERLAEAGRPALVISASAAGWGTAQALLFARDHLDLFRPSWIVVTVCSNDQVDDQVFHARASGGLLPTFPGKRFVRDHFYLYGKVYALAYNALYRRSVLKSGAREDPEPDGAVSPEAPEPAPAAPGASWHSTGEQLREFMAHVRAKFPSAVMFVQAAEFWKPQLSAGVRDMADGGSVVFVDQAAGLEGTPPEQLVLGFDQHWNQQTHAEVARRLSQAILAHEASPGP